VRSAGLVFHKARLEAFSDGVFAIAITLLVLDIGVKAADTPLQEFLNAWPSYVGYVISFLTIGAAWISHSAITEDLATVDAVFLRLNLLLLMVVVFLPFPTTLVTEGFGDRDKQRVAAAAYGVTLLAIKLMGMALDRYAQTEGLYRPEAQDEELIRTRRSSWRSVSLYVIAIVVGLVLPGIAVAVYFGVAVYVIIPWHQVSRLHRSAGSPAS
jgi:uncharacterized membrane protein